MIDWFIRQTNNLDPHQVVIQLLQDGMEKHQLPFTGIHKDCYGKPFLNDQPNRWISLSHSGDYVLAIISDHKVGCDIQQNNPIKENVVHRVLSKHEQNSSFSFYDFWTLKESYIKLLGKQDREYNQIEFSSTDPSKIILPSPAQKYLLLDCIPGYTIAMLSEGSELPEQLEFLD